MTSPSAQFQKLKEREGKEGLLLAPDFKIHLPQFPTSFLPYSQLPLFRDRGQLLHLFSFLHVFYISFLRGNEVWCCIIYFSRRFVHLFLSWQTEIEKEGGGGDDDDNCCQVEKGKKRQRLFSHFYLSQFFCSTLEEST